MFRYILVLMSLVIAGAVAWLAIGTILSPSEHPEGASAPAVVAISAARRGNNAASPDDEPGKPRQADAADTRTMEPDRPPLQDQAPRPLAARVHAARAPDFGKLLEAYDSISAETLEEFNARYAGAIAFRTEEELDWMAEQGFPLPEEILAAANMSLDDLRAFADDGDPTAQFLYLDRTLQEVRELRQSYLRSGISPDGLTEIPEYGDALIRAAYAKSFLTGSDSPFAGYLMAEFSRAAFNNPYGYMAGLLHASHLGDPRAYGKLRAFVRQNDISEDALNAMGAYAVIVEGRGMLTPE